jgi:cysteine desulfuration protein SufE
MFKGCLEKQQRIVDAFAQLRDAQARYEKVIALGRGQSALPADQKNERNLVPGCQSLLYLVTEERGGLLYFTSESDALISAGLALLLTEVYSGEAPETVLKCPPGYLEEIGIQQSLSPGRANGLANIHLRMKKDALQALTTTLK